MKLLVVVDYQKDFVDGTLGFEGAEKLDEKIAAKIKKYADEKEMIVATFDTHYNYPRLGVEGQIPAYMGTREGKALPVEHCIIRTDGWDMYGKSKESYDEARMTTATYDIYKESFGVSPHNMMALRDVLHSQRLRFARNGKSTKVESVELVGLVSNVCVVSNAVVFQAAFPEAQIIVDTQCTDSFDKEKHEATLKVLEGLQVQLL